MRRRKKEVVSQTVATRLGLKPSLDYLHGYPVTGNTTKTITFENGAVVALDDDTIIAIKRDELVGMTLLTVIYTKDAATLRFGGLGHGSKSETSIPLPAGSFTIADPRFSETHKPMTQPEPEAHVGEEYDEPEEPEDLEIIGL